MNPIRATSEVFDAIQMAKAGASAFSTNFYPNVRKLEDWIGRDELFGEVFGRTVLFLRADHDFWHLYFSAPNSGELQRAVGALPELKAMRLVVDVIGVGPTVAPLLSLFQSVGFRRYKDLYRMARPAGKGEAQTAFRDERIELAHPADSRALFDLICQSFDRYAEQLPPLSEIENATESGQILAARTEGAIAGLLYFEDQGFTSSVRYWLVDRLFRDRGFGSSLMGCYFARHAASRRFILWVLSDNDHAIAKYRQHGFAPDGLVDYVLANEMICS